MIVRVSLLHSIICQMYFFFESSNVKLVWRCPNIALLIPISSSYSIEIGNQHIMSNVKFPVVVKHWSIDVHLHNISLFCLLFLFRLKGLNCAWIGTSWSWCSLFENAVQLVDLIYNSYAPSLVAVLPWLHNPNVSHFIFVGLPLLLLLFLLFQTLFCSFFIII